MSEHEPESVRRLQRAMALVGERASVTTITNPASADARNREGLTWTEWARAAALKPVGSFGTFDPASYRPERKAWRDGEDPAEWRARPRKRREPAPLPERPPYVSDEPKERPGRDLPFYDRTLDSYDDATITSVRPSTSDSGYYAVLDWGPKRYPGDPDFGTYGRTREEAIGLCAKSIREDARGIGKYAPHSCLVPGHDLHFRLMKHWADKEAEANKTRELAGRIRGGAVGEDGFIEDRSDEEAEAQAAADGWVDVDREDPNFARRLSDLVGERAVAPYEVLARSRGTTAGFLRRMGLQGRPPPHVHDTDREVFYLTVAAQPRVVAKALAGVGYSPAQRDELQGLVQGLANTLRIRLV